MAVTRIEITSRTPFARGESFGDVGPYEQLDGVIYFAVDPEHPANSTITDLTLAPPEREWSGGVLVGLSYPPAG